MSLIESHVEEAALEWFGELGYALGHDPHLAPGEPAAERDSFGDVVLVGRLREAIARRKSKKIGGLWLVERVRPRASMLVTMESRPARLNGTYHISSNLDCYGE